MSLGARWIARSGYSTQDLRALEVLDEEKRARAVYRLGVSWPRAKGSFPRRGRQGGSGRRGWSGRPQGVICVIYTSHEHRRVYNRACPLDSRDYTSLS